MIRRTTVLLLIVLLCNAAFAAPISHSEREIKKLADPYIKAVVDSYNNTNYAKMARFFNDIMFDDFSSEKFKNIRDEIFPSNGRIKSAKFMGFITQQEMTVILYKGEFEKGQGLIKLVLSTGDKGIEISGLWFE